MDGQLFDQTPEGGDAIAVTEYVTEIIGNEFNKGMSKPKVRRMEKLGQSFKDIWRIS